MNERRGYPTWRRDINDAVRDESGNLSPSKIGGIVGQIIACNYLIAHWEKVISTWDILTILLSVLVAPELFKKLLVMKYGGKDEPPPITKTVATAEVTTTTTEKPAKKK